MPLSSYALIIGYPIIIKHNLLKTLQLPLVDTVAFGDNNEQHDLFFIEISHMITLSIKYLFRVMINLKHKYVIFACSIAHIFQKVSMQIRQK